MFRFRRISGIIHILIGYRYLKISKYRIEAFVARSWLLPDNINLNPLSDFEQTLLVLGWVHVWHEVEEPWLRQQLKVHVCIQDSTRPPKKLYGLSWQPARLPSCKLFVPVLRWDVTTCSFVYRPGTVVTTVSMSPFLPRVLVSLLLRFSLV